MRIPTNADNPYSPHGQTRARPGQAFSGSAAADGRRGGSPRAGRPCAGGDPRGARTTLEAPMRKGCLGLILWLAGTGPVLAQPAPAHPAAPPASKSEADPAAPAEKMPHADDKDAPAPAKAAAAPAPAVPNPAHLLNGGHGAPFQFAVPYDYQWCFWFTGEYLLWWVKNDQAPPLVTTGPLANPF